MTIQVALELQEIQQRISEATDDRIVAKLQAREAELKEQLEAEKGEQKEEVEQESLLEEYFASGIYERVYGDREEGTPIYEYEDNRKTFYIGVYGIAKQTVDAVREQYVNRIDVINDKHLSKMSALYNELGEKSDDLEKSRQSLAQSQQALEAAESALDALNAEKEELLQRIKELELSNRDKSEQVEKLEMTVENLQRPKIIMPGDNVRDLVNNIKPAKKKEESQVRAIAYGLERLGLDPLKPGELQIPTFGVPQAEVTQFRTDQEHNQEAVPPVQEVGFRQTEETEQMAGESSTMGQSAGGNARLEAIEKRLTAVEARIGLREVS